ncbi:MAG: SdrD B-like domain-containing protein [bacterium]
MPLLYSTEIAKKSQKKIKLKSKSKLVSGLIIAFCLCLLILGGIALVDQFTNRSFIAKAAGEPVITLGIVQKTGTAPFTGTCTVGGTIYTAGEDACDSDRVVRTLDTIEYSQTVSVSVANATNVRIIHTLPTGMTWNYTTDTLPVYCNKGAGFTPSSSVTGQTLICNVGNVAAGNSTAYPFVAKVRGENLNASMLSTPSTDTTATADTTLVPGSFSLPDLVVSASPRYDLSSHTNSKHNVSVLGPFGEAGILVQPQYMIAIPNIKGSEILAQPLNFKAKLDYTTPPAAGQSFTGAKLYTWGTASCQKINDLSLGSISILNKATYTPSCTQDAGINGQINITISGLDSSGNVNSGDSDGVVVADRVLIWVPLSDIQATGGNLLGLTFTVSNFSPVSVSNIPNNITGIEANLGNNQAVNTINTATSMWGYYNHSAIGGDNTATIGTTLDWSTVIQNSSIINNINNLSLCSTVDPTKTTFESAWIEYTQPAINADISNAIYEYTDSSLDCGDGTGTWYTNPDLVPGGKTTINRIRFSGIQGVRPGVYVILKIRAKILDVSNGTVVTNIGGIKTPDYGGNVWIPWGGPGNSVAITRLRTNVTRTIIEDNGNNTLTQVSAGKTATYRLGYGSYTELNTPGATTNLTIQDLLAPGQTYLIGSASAEPDSVAVQGDGSTLLTWTKTVPYNTSNLTNFITYKAIASAFAPTGTVFNNRSQVSSPDDFRSLAINLLSPVGTQCTEPRGAYYTSETPGTIWANLSFQVSCTTSSITVSNLSLLGVEKIANTPVVQKNQPLQYTLRYGNLDVNNDIASTQLIDIFPFNNQVPSREPATVFTGSLAFTGLGTTTTSGNDGVANGEIVQYTKTSPVGTNALSNDPCDVSNNPAGSPVNTNPRCASVDVSVIGTGTTIWCDESLNGTVLGTTGTAGADATSCPSSFGQITALRLTTGSLPKPSTTTSIYSTVLNFTTSGNAGGDIYNNLTQARAVGVPIVSTTNSAVIQVKAGTISGNIFNDKDQNRAKNAGDGDLAGISVELRAGTTPSGTLITTTTSDSAGNYSFSNLSSGDYTVVVLGSSLPSLRTQTFDRDYTANPIPAALDSITTVNLSFSVATGVVGVNDANFGYYVYSNLTGKLYPDSNNNGIQDGGENDFNSTTNLIPSGTSVVITSTTNPSISFNLTSSVSTTVVAGFTTQSLGSDGSYTQNLPADTYTVNVITTNPKYSISTSTQLGDGTGANPTTVTVLENETKSGGKDGLYLILIQNSDIASLVCTPTSNINQNVSCTITLVDGKDFSTLTGDIKIQISDGVQTSCPVFPATGNTLTCTAILVGGLIGNLTPVYSVNGGTPISTNSSPITIVNPLTPAQIAALIIDCASAPINSTTTCTFTIPDNTTLPDGFKLGIGDATPAGTCTTGTGVDVNKVTCIAVPTGSQTGAQAIVAQVGTNPVITTAGVSNIFQPPTTITQTNISNSSNCTAAMILTIPDSYSCSFALTGNASNDYSPAAGDTVASTSSATGNSAICTIIANQTIQASLSCTLIPTTNGTIGLQNVLVTIAGGTATDKGDVTLQNNVTDSLFIDPSKLNFNPIESAAVKFGVADLTLTVGGNGKDDPKYTANGTTAVCKFKLKEFGALDADPTKGFNASLNKLAATQVGIPGGARSTDNTTFDVPYSTTSGCSVKLLPEGQNQPKWLFETKVVRSDTQVFARDNAYFMTYGAIGGVSISG